MRLLKILFVLSAVILLAGTVIFAHSIGVSATWESSLCKSRWAVF